MDCAEILSAFFMIYLFKNRIGQFHSKVFPSSLAGVCASRQILIASFERTEVVRVHYFLQFAVRSEEDAVLVIDREFA